MKKRERIYEQNIHIYVLQLENGCYYIGQSINIERRIEEHRQGKGASFTKLNPVLSLGEIFDTGIKKLIDAEVYEDFFVMKYIEQHGAEKVKGGSFLQSSKKRESRFRFYRDFFLEAKECLDPPKAFFKKISTIREQAIALQDK